MDAGFAVDFGDGGDHAQIVVIGIRRLLGDHELRVRPRGDLRQVGDDDDLRAAGQPCQTFAQFDRGLATHAGVNLVEDEGLVGTAARVGGHQLQGQHQSAQFTARSAFAHRQLRRPLERRKQERDIVATIRAERIIGLVSRRDAHFQGGAQHGERAEFFSDARTQVGSGSHARGAQHVGGGEGRIVQRLPFGFEFGDLFRRGIQILQIERRLVPPSEHVGQGGAPPTGEVAKLVDTAVDLVQILHAAFVAQLLAQGEHHVAQIGIDGFKPIGLHGERAADANRAQRGHRMIDEFHGRSAVGGVHIHLRGIQRAQRRTHALGDVGRVFDAFAARLQLLILPRLRVDSVDAVDGFAQVVGLLAGRGFLRAQAFQPLIHGGQRIPRLAVGGQFGFVSGHPVQKLALPCGGRDFQLIGLAMNGNQFAGDGPQHRTRYGLAAEHGPRTSGSAYGAGKEQFAVFGVDARVMGLGHGRGSTGEPTVGIARTGIVGVAGMFRCDGIIRERENRLGPSLVRPGRDARGFGGPTGNQSDRGEQHGFAGAGLTGDGGHACGRRNGGFSNRSQIADIEFFEHQDPALPSRSPDLSGPVPATPASPATATPTAYAAAGNVCP